MTGFEDIYRAHFKDVYLYLCRLSGDEQLAQDLTGDTFYRAFRSMDSFRGECDVRLWLLRIAKNCYYTHCKKTGHIKIVESTEAESLPDTHPPIEEELVKREQAKRIRTLLHDLTEPYKEVFMWRVYGELSFREIGNMFGKSENWACVTYHRAAKMIRKELEGEP